jgi:hypothetical protein
MYVPEVGNRVVVVKVAVGVEVAIGAGVDVVRGSGRPWMPKTASMETCTLKGSLYPCVGDDSGVFVLVVRAAQHVSRSAGGQQVSRSAGQQVSTSARQQARENATSGKQELDSRESTE